MFAAGFLQIPTRDAPLPWAVRFPLLGLARDLQPLADTHAERTKEKAGLQEPRFFFYH